MDRRRKRTKKLLIDALVKLMKEKEVRKITVKDVADEADINRGTFYLHYYDIYDMLDNVENEVIDNIVKIIDKNNSLTLSPNEKAVFTTILEVIDYLQENIELCKALMGINGDISFIKKLEETIIGKFFNSMSNQLSEKDKIVYHYYAIFVVSGGIGAFRSWILSENPVPISKMIYSFKYILTKGINDTFGNKDDN